METLPYLVPLFFLTALSYSTAGFGGGSTYLALLALFSFPYAAMPQTALFCNLIVVSGGCILFIRQGTLSWQRILPFVVTSIPFAYLGGRMPIGKKLFTLLLALSLLSAALRLLLSEETVTGDRIFDVKQTWKVGPPVGAALGFISGLVGIGGGIFLSPLLLIMKWADARQAAAAASFFILVNSLAGLFGQITKGGTHLAWQMMLPLLAAVFAGGQIGTRLGTMRLSKLSLQRITAVLILSVSVRLFWGLWVGGVQ